MSFSFLLLVPILLIALVATIVVVLVLALRPRREPGLGVRAAASGLPPEGSWNVSLHQGALGATTGVTGLFDVRGGVLSFIPWGASEPQWSYHCTQLSAGAGSGFGPHPVTVYTPDGEVQCTVSEEQINRFSQNTAKDGRVTGYGFDFVRVLAANGARQV